MLPSWVSKFRFSLKSVFVLILGIAIGFALNVQTLQLLTGLASNETYRSSLGPYVIEPPDILRIDLVSKFPDALPSISGQHLVGPDGRINLGTYGQVLVAGMTLAEVKDAVELQLSKSLLNPRVSVEVFAYNSQVYYIVTQGQDTGDSVLRVPLTGNETVLDGIARIDGLNAPEITEVWIARPSLNGVSPEQILSLEWDKVARGASTTTNYQLLPHDRLFVSRKPKSAATN